MKILCIDLPWMASNKNGNRKYYS